LRQLILLRGSMAAGKSTWVKQNNLQQYVLGADDIRLLFQTPVMTESGKFAINAKNDGRVWQLLMNLLEERMKRGEFTIIDATHAKQEMISQYKELCQKYRYRCTIVDFSDVPLDTLLEQNKMRGEHKHVPEHVIMNAHERLQTEHVPKWVNVIKPDEFDNVMKFTETVFGDQYKRIHHIGDVHGCYDALMQYFLQTGHYFHDGYPVLDEREMYIFVGDLLDRGIQNAETLKFFLHIYNRKNVAILEGNHEVHLWRWANDEECKSKDFANHTQPELEAQFMNMEQIAEGSTDVEYALDTEALDEYKKEVRQLYRKLRQIVYYVAHGKEVVVTHGGLAKLPRNLMFMATEQFIKGVGDYEIDIDNAWDNNLPVFMKEYDLVFYDKDYNFDKVPTELETADIYQIHGHRNLFRLPVQAGEYSFNLEGQVEFGNNLRVVTLTADGFKTYEIKNDVFLIRQFRGHIKVDEKDLNIDKFIEYMVNHKEINEKHLGGNIYSYNFTRAAFQDKIWDDINIKARGLFINKNTKEIVSRSYNKFFNVNERSFTKMNALADNLKFPVQVYDKPNGYLGTVGYDSESDKLIFTSKSDINTEHAEWLRDLFYQTFDELSVTFVKEYLQENNLNLVFEVIKVEADPHIIEYANDKLVLLDIVKRQVVYEKLPYEEVVRVADIFEIECKKLAHTFENWTDMYKWYRDVSQDMSLRTEGFVIEDDVGFMTKIKLPYYNFWKQFRGVKDKFAKRHEHTIKGGSMFTALHNTVFKWMKGQDPNWLKASGIITVRKQFESDQKTNAMTDLMVKSGVQ
jgi:predicted kinase